MTDVVKVADKGHVRTITLNRPDKKNALSNELAWGVVAAVEDAAKVDDVWVVAITGSGDSFCAGLDLSGGERKRSETLQLAVLRPHIAVLDELDSGLDVDGLRDVAHRVRAGVDEWGLGVLAITHYQRLLSVLRPDVVHVLVGGRIVASGGPDMAEELERTGYAQYITPGDVVADARPVRRPGFTDPI